MTEQKTKVVAYSDVTDEKFLSELDHHLAYLKGRVPNAMIEFAKLDVTQIIEYANLEREKDKRADVHEMAKESAKIAKRFDGNGMGYIKKKAVHLDGLAGKTQGTSASVTFRGAVKMDDGQTVYLEIHGIPHEESEELKEIKKLGNQISEDLVEIVNKGGAGKLADLMTLEKAGVRGVDGSKTVTLSKKKFDTENYSWQVKGGIRAWTKKEEKEIEAEKTILRKKEDPSEVKES